jgi:hypothetical protein
VTADRSELLLSMSSLSQVRLPLRFCLVAEAQVWKRKERRGAATVNDETKLAKPATLQCLRLPGIT